MVKSRGLKLLLLSAGMAADNGLAAEQVQSSASLSEALAQPESVAPEIIVTARRRDERLLDAPVAITAISGETLGNYQVTRVSDLATQVPMLIAGRAASGSSASIFLRGIGSTALSAGFDQSVSFVIDNLPMSRGREISLPQFDVQRVEVLKGPQALFFGKNTTGGLISIVSNGPTDRFEVGGRIGYGIRAQEKYSEAYVSGPVTEALKARLAIRYANSEGAFTNTAAPIYPTVIPGQNRTRLADKRGFAETVMARASLEWQPTAALSFQLKAGVSNVQDGGPTDIIERICGGGRTIPAIANGIPPSPNADCRIDGRSDSSALPVQVAQANYRYARDGRLYSEFTSQYGVLTSKIESDPFDVTSITGIYHFKQPDLNNVSGEAYPASFSQLADFTQYSQELRFQSKFNKPLNILFGGFYSHGRFVFNTDAYIFPVPFDPVTGTFVTFKRDNGFSTDTLSLFAEATLAIGSKLELSAGARYTDEARDSYQRSLPAHSAFAGAFPGNISLKDRYREDNISPQVTLRYKPEADTTLYASYKQGFKAGGFNISQALTPAANVEAGRYLSELAEGGEIGLRTLLSDRRLALNVTAYRYEYSDLQVQFFDPQAVSLTAGNAGKLRTRGIEADFSWRIPVASAVTVRGAAAFNDARYVEFIGQCYPGQTIADGCNLLPANGIFNGQDYAGRTPPKAPRWAGRAGVTWELPLSSAGFTLRSTADVGYTSRYNFTDTLRPDAVQPAVTRIDAAVSLVHPDQRWTLSVIGRNLSNRLMVTAANDIPFTGGTGTGTAGPGVVADMSAFVDNPREMMIELAVRF